MTTWSALTPGPSRCRCLDDTYYSVFVMRSTRDPRSWLVVVLVLAPLLISVALVGRYGVDVPVGDQWSIATMFSRGWQLPPVRELLAQANESRPFFPKLLFVTVAQLGEWDVRREMLLTQILLAGVAAGLVYLWSRTDRTAPPGAGSAARPSEPVAVLTDAIRQFLLGHPADRRRALPLPRRHPGRRRGGYVAADPAGVVRGAERNRDVLVRQRHPRLVTVGARHRLDALGVASPALADVGVVALNVGCLCVDLLPRPGRRIGAELKPGPRRPSRRAPRAVSRPVGAGLSARTERLPLAKTKFGYRPGGPGAPCSSAWRSVFSYLMGGARRARVGRSVVLWGTVVAYGLVSGVLTVAGRLTYGPDYMLASRYVAFSATVLIGAVALTTLAGNELYLASGRRARGAVIFVAIATAAALAGLTGLAMRNAVADIREVHRSRLQAAAVLDYYAVASVDDLHRLVYWSDTIVLDRMPGLLANGIRRDRARDTAFVRGSFTDAAGCLERSIGEPDGRIRLEGWSYLPGSRPADAVIVTPVGRTTVIAVSVPALPRQDVAISLSDPQALVSGWQIVAPLDSGPVEVWAYDAERGAAFEVPGQCGSAVR